MRRVCTLACDVHSDDYECPDVLVHYLPKYDEYGLIVRDGGTSVARINFCPFCGQKLPDSKRDMWFDTLEKMGFDDPTNQNIPDDFKTDLWFRLKT
jgi:hypothetical protein